MIAIRECPSRADIVLRSTPFSSPMVAWAWRSEWRLTRRTPTLGLTLATARSNSRLNRSGWYGRPSGCEHEIVGSDDPAERCGFVPLT